MFTKKNYKKKNVKRKSLKKKQFGSSVYFLDQIIGNDKPKYIGDDTCNTKKCCYKKETPLNIDEAYAAEFNNNSLKKKYDKLESDYYNLEEKEMVNDFETILRNDFDLDINLDNQGERL